MTEAPCRAVAGNATVTAVLDASGDWLVCVLFLEEKYEHSILCEGTREAAIIHGLNSADVDVNAPALTCLYKGRYKDTPLKNFLFTLVAKPVDESPLNQTALESYEENMIRNPPSISYQRLHKGEQMMESDEVWRGDRWVPLSDAGMKDAQPGQFLKYNGAIVRRKSIHRKS